MRTHFALVKANTVDTIPIEVSANDRDTMIHQSNRERLRVYTRWAKKIWMGPAALEGVSHQLNRVLLEIEERHVRGEEEGGRGERPLHSEQIRSVREVIDDV